MKRAGRFCWLFILLLGDAEAGFRWIPMPVYGMGDPAAVQMVHLIAPLKNVTITDESITFKWICVAPDEIPKMGRYTLKIWNSYKSYSETITMIPDESEDEVVSLTVSDFRKILKRHGVYYWKVIGTDENGGQCTSESGSFIVGLQESQKGNLPLYYPYEIKYQYHNRLDTKEYTQFLRNVSPRGHMQSYSDLGFVFYQKNRRIPVDFEETFFISSQIGLGFKLVSRLCVWRNVYFALFPSASFAASWFSTGFETYTSNLMDVRVGMELSFMPAGNLTLRAQYIPAYLIHYAQADGGLRTFQGLGWAFGIRWIVPYSILPPFRIFGLEIDFKKIPLEFDWSRIEDKYTGVQMDMRRISVSYLLW